VAEELLHCSDIVTAFQKLRGEGMTEGVAGRTLGQASLFHRAGNGLLKDGFVNRVAPLLAGLGVCPSVLLGKDPLPAPFGRGVGIFAVEGGR